MQHSPTEIKEKLLKAVDKEYNVLDMGTVVEVITILERTPITKEALESTRLGKYVNELRRKTTNESLAKRAKDLVRQWRHLIPPSENSPASSQVSASNHQKNGLNITNRLGGALSPGLLSRENTLSPGLSQKNSISPVLSPYYSVGGGNVASARLPSISPATSLASSEKSNSPSLQVHPSSSSVSRVGGKKPSTCLCTPPTTHNSQTKTLRGHRPESPNPVQSHVNLVLVSESVPKTHVANKRLRKDSPMSVEELHRRTGRPNGEFISSSQIDVVGDCSRDSFGGSSDHGSLIWDVCVTPNIEVPKDNGLNVKRRGRKHVVSKGVKVKVTRGENLSSSTLPSGDDIVKEKIASIAKISKVKTTQELLAGLQDKTVQSSTTAENLSNVNYTSENKASLANCVLGSNRGSPSDALEISRKKTEHIAKFLRSQSGIDTSKTVTPTEPVRSLAGPGERNSADISSTKTSKDHSQSSCTVVHTSEQLVLSKDSHSVLVKTDDTVDKVVNEILSRLPPINYDAISWDDSEDKVESSLVVSNTELLDKLSTEHVESVTGNYSHAKTSDGTRKFCEWHEPVSRTSYGGELLDILPYVIID